MMHDVVRPLRFAPCAPAYSRFARIYDRTIGNNFFAQLRRVFEKIIRRNRIKFSSAADLGCGTGQFARYLNSCWKIPVFGIDRPPAMLRVAFRRCHGRPIILLRQDMREFQLPQLVDLVTANFDTINYLTDERDVQHLFKRVHSQLKPGGHFIFDVITPCAQRSVTRRFGIVNGPVFERIFQRIRWFPRRHIFVSQMEFFRSTTRRRTVEHHQQRAYRPEHIARWLADAGFIVRDALDPSTMRPATHCPARLVVVAQKCPYR